MHHVNEWDFSVALQNAVNQVDWAAAFEAERMALSKEQDVPW
jgi:hypothetical protein